MKFSRIRIGWPQRIAALFLLIFLAQCTWIIGRTPLSESDYRYALCGREMWEKPGVAAGYFTSCGNMQGDGTLAYRVAGLPLTSAILVLRAQDAILRGIDHFKPAGKRTYVANPIGGATHDLRHQIVGIPYLLRLPFALFGVWIGGGVWWVARRLFGNLGGFLALGLFCFSPAVVRYATMPNNEILALWGLYGLIYTAIGIAHAMYGPRRQWRPRILIFTLALGLTTAAHLLAAIFGLIVSTVLLFYVAERRRSAVLPLLAYTTLGALFILLASYAFRFHAFLYAFTGGAARLNLSYEPALLFVRNAANLPTLIALAVALVLYLLVPRARYFGNTTPFLVALLLLPLVTTQIATSPWLWALPFLFTFIAGVFADALETRQRKLYLALSGVILLAQATLCFLALPAMHA
jgi:hypothetical protein